MEDTSPCSQGALNRACCIFRLPPMQDQEGGRWQAHFYVMNGDSIVTNRPRGHSHSPAMGPEPSSFPPTMMPDLLEQFLSLGPVSKYARMLAPWSPALHSLSFCSFSYPVSLPPHFKPTLGDQTQQLTGDLVLHETFVHQKVLSRKTIFGIQL